MTKMLNESKVVGFVEALVKSLITKKITPKLSFTSWIKQT